MTLRRWTVTAHVDCTRVANEIQLRLAQRVGNLRVHDDRSRRGSDWNGYRDDSAAGRRIVGIHVPSSLLVVMTIVVVMMNRRYVRMSVASSLIGSGVHMKRKSLRLHGAHRHGNHGGEVRTHVLSLWDTPQVRQRGAAHRLQTPWAVGFSAASGARQSLGSR